MNIIGILSPSLVWALCIWIPGYSLHIKTIMTIFMLIGIVCLSSYSKPGHSGLLWKISMKISNQYDAIVIYILMIIIYAFQIAVALLFKAYIPCVIPAFLELLFISDLFLEVKYNANSNNKK